MQCMHLYSQSDGSNIRTDQCCRFVILIINSVDFSGTAGDQAWIFSCRRICGFSVDFTHESGVDFFFVDINVQCCIFKYLFSV